MADETKVETHIVSRGVPLGGNNWVPIGSFFNIIGDIMSELFFATKKKESFQRGMVPDANLVKFVEDRVGAACALAEGWKVYKLDAVEVFTPEIQFSDKAPAKEVEKLDHKV